MDGINETEWDLLQVLWERERATAREVMGDLQERRGWAYSTVKTMLDRMVDKGLVASRRVGPVWEFSPAVQPADAQRSAWKRFVNSAFGGSMAPALEFLAGDARLKKRERDALRALLDESEGKRRG